MLFGKYECICEEQAGLRKGYSTMDHIFNLKCLVDLYLHRNKHLLCAFIDYMKAFDSFWQKLLQQNVNLWKNVKDHL